jgi:hypothetical protein
VSTPLIALITAIVTAFVAVWTAVMAYLTQRQAASASRDLELHMVRHQGDPPD